MTEEQAYKLAEQTEPNIMEVDNPLRLLILRALGDKTIPKFDHEKKTADFFESAYLDGLSGSYTMVRYDVDFNFHIYIGWKPLSFWFKCNGEGYSVEDISGKPEWYMDECRENGVIFGNWFVEKLTKK